MNRGEHYATIRIKIWANLANCFIVFADYFSGMSAKNAEKDDKVLSQPSLRLIGELQSCFANLRPGIASRDVLQRLSFFRPNSSNDFYARKLLDAFQAHWSPITHEKDKNLFSWTWSKAVKSSSKMRHQRSVWHVIRREPWAFVLVKALSKTDLSKSFVFQSKDFIGWLQIVLAFSFSESTRLAQRSRLQHEMSR